MHTRTPRFVAAAAALALFAGACTDTPTTPASGTAGAHPSVLTTRSGARLVSSAVKYRDQGGKPATGRSGNAVVNALALLDQHGTTTLSITTRHATDWWQSGYIRRAQIKGWSADGKHRFTRNMNGYDNSSPEIVVPLSRFPNELHFTGLSRGDRLQVQANVAGLDGERTDVVTVTESVKRLPDLRVQVAAPAEVQTGTPVNIMAVVAEHNGDMGAFAECDLYVGGSLVDRAAGVWIDAGDAVSCAMTWSFAVPGSYPVEVRVSTNTREWDIGNNADSATIQVHGDSPSFFTSASFNHVSHVDSVLLEQSWRDGGSGLAGESVYEEVNAFASQYANMYAWMPAQIPGSLNVHASMTTGGRLVTSTTFSQSADGTAPVCVSEYDGRAMLDVCTYNYEGAGSTSINYSYAAGSVTYHSREYSRMWDQLTGEDLSVYHWNTDYGWDDGLLPLGDDWRFEVTVNSPGGAHVAAHTLRLEPQPSQVYVEPYTCNTYDEPFWDYSSTVCRAASFHAEFIYGF